MAVKLYLASFDTGRNTGYAIFQTWGYCYLVDCGVCSPDLHTLYGLFEKWPIGYLVAEKPQHYMANKSKGDPNHLTPLAIQCGDLRGLAYCAGVRDDGSDGADLDRLSLWYPSQWKKQLPKWITQQDCIRALTPVERSTAGSTTQLDKWDAIALGLYELDRLGFRRSWDR